MEEGLISVDSWQKSSQAYFLTHIHSDHTRGLSSTWSHAPLYCSPITADLLPFKFRHFDLSLLRIIHVGTWHSLTLRSPSSGKPTTVQFIAIDACHCPGSVMLLFRGDFGRVLYTGDFRWELGCERASKAKEMLAGALNGAVVDVVYLDNTYCNPIYDFPSRQVTTQQVIDIIKSHPDHDVIIGINNYGKEDLLAQIARELKIVIWVWPDRLETMHLLGYGDYGNHDEDDDDIFTSNVERTRVKAVPQKGITIKTLEALNNLRPHGRPIVGILPSGLPWVKKDLQGSELVSDYFPTSQHKRAKQSEDDKFQMNRPIEKIEPPEKIHEYIYTVPYSDHSNFREIEDFIKLVKPAKLKGIVPPSSCYIEPLYYFGHLCHAKQPIELSNNVLKRKGNSTRFGAVSIRKSLGGASVRNGGMTLKTKFLRSRLRLSRLSIMRRIRRGAKILVGDSCNHD